MRRLLSSGACTLFLLALALPDPALATIHTVNVGNFFFSPTKTQVLPGDTVRWVWVGGSHSTTSVAGSSKSWDSGILSSGTFDVVFTAADGPGPFPYHCTLHPSTMKDTIFWAPTADLDGDGFDQTSDCNDADGSIYPGAPEIADDGIDQDCDGVDATLCYSDNDGDGYGFGGGSVELSGVCPAGKSSNNLDCDDSNSSVYPGAPEIPGDGVDQDCNGADAILCYVDADGDLYGDHADPGTVETSGSCPVGSLVNNLDCNDLTSSIYPGAPETPDDGIDQDCDGSDATTCYIDADGDGWGSSGDPGTVEPSGVCPPGKANVTGDCHDANASVHPGAAETCDGTDEDCDGWIDEEAVGAATWYRDADGDGYGDPAIDSLACSMPSGYVANGDDCDDTNPSVTPPCGCCALRGDVNSDTAVNVGDLTFLVSYLFSGGPAPACMDQADASGDSSVNVGDLTFLVNYLFKGGLAPGAC